MIQIMLIKDESGTYAERELIYSPLPWQEKGLRETRTGYGGKLTSSYKIRYAGKIRRVYRVQWSNAGSLYVIAKGTKIFL